MRTQARRMYKKFLLGSIIVLGATTVAVSATILLEVAHLSDVIKEHGHTIRSLGEGDVTRADAGGPQTIMILGSDHRKQDQPGDRPHSDTTCSFGWIPIARPRP